LPCLIRLVRKSDAPGIYAVERACFHDPYPSIFLDDLMKAQHEHFLVALHGESIIGYAVASTVDRAGHVVSIAVDPDHRRRHVGRALLSALESRLIEEGIEQIRLEVRKGNLAAISFYKQMGYRETSQILRYYADCEDACVFERSVKDPQMDNSERH
jgi:[ribosomal protein S18]-alanine N-acetyltransferase